MSGSQMRWNVFAGEQLIALLSFGASAWKLAARELVIGWEEPRRLKNGGAYFGRVAGPECARSCE